MTNLHQTSCTKLVKSTTCIKSVAFLAEFIWVSLCCGWASIRRCLYCRVIVQNISKSWLNCGAHLSSKLTMCIYIYWTPSILGLIHWSTCFHLKGLVCLHSAYQRQTYCFTSKIHGTNPTILYNNNNNRHVPGHLKHWKPQPEFWLLFAQAHHDFLASPLKL